MSTYYCNLLTKLKTFAALMLAALSLSCCAAFADYTPAVNDHLTRGLEFLNKDKLGSARQEFEEAAKIDPRCHEALHNIGLCYGRDNELDRAAEYYRKALAIAPSYMPSLNNMGSLMYRQRNYDEASMFYKQALSIVDGKDAEIQTS